MLLAGIAIEDQSVQDRPFRTALVMALVGIWAGLPSATEAEPMPALSLEDRADLHAVGRVNTAGYRRKGICTGTLIAPTLVLTAAHCVEFGVQHGIPIQFVAGWDRGSFVAHRQSKDVVIHPGYEGAEGREKLAFDLAVVHLEEPIPHGLIDPIPLAEIDPDAIRPAHLLGYHSRRPNVLNGNFDCAADPRFQSTLCLYACEVIAGNSGGPVLEKTEGGWVLTGVIIARENATGNTVTAPVDDWLMDQWSAELALDQSGN